MVVNCKYIIFWYYIMNLTKSNGLENNLVKTIDTFNLPIPRQEVPKPHFTALVVAPTGCGKTNLMSNFLGFYQDKQYEEKPIFDCMVLISPSSFPNKMGFKSENKFDKFKWDEIHSNFSDKTMNLIIKNQEARIKEYLDYEQDLKTYNQLMEDSKVENKIIIDYFKRFPNLSKPTCRFDRIPTCIICMDDICNANRQASLSEFISRSRHLNCSFITAVQALTQASSHLRQNCSVLILLKTNNSKTLETIYDEFTCNDFTKDQWQDICKLPEAKQDFIMLDQKEQDRNKKYRLGFDRFINIM